MFCTTGAMNVTQTIQTSDDAPNAVAHAHDREENGYRLWKGMGGSNHPITTLLNFGNVGSGTTSDSRHAINRLNLACLMMGNQAT